MNTILITGVAGEVGSSLVTFLAENSQNRIVGFDIRPPANDIATRCHRIELGDISDRSAVERIGASTTFDTIFHLAGILSSGGERNPIKAHDVNVSGTVNILELARIQSQQRGKPVTVIFTSTIAAYGIGSIEQKRTAGTIQEHQFLTPITMYGANKLYCESLGRYYSQHFGMLEATGEKTRIDFRAVRFPGILSAHTLPTGGTSDYAPEMVHTVAQGLPYQCFVRPDSRIPFMMMPDAVRALILLSQAEQTALTQRVYNVAGFAPSAREIAALSSEFFPHAIVTYKPHPARQVIVDSWPEDIDDTAARRDFGWAPLYSFERGFAEYLIPAVVSRYGGSSSQGLDLELAAN